jgi:hypothetical protein
MRQRPPPPHTHDVTTTALVQRAPRMTSGVIAFVGPWLLVAMGSPLYTEHAGRGMLTLWAVGLVVGGICALGGAMSRRVGLAVLSGTLAGAGLFVLVFGLVVLIAPV